MGMDAEVSYAFHSERKLNPEKFKNQLLNQSTYAKIGCTQGWFGTSLFDSSKKISHLAKVKVIKKNNTTWQDLTIPDSTRSIVCLNLPSFAGGLNPWGTPNIKKCPDAHRIRFEFHKGAADHIFMRIDGEPWKQPLPADDDTVVVEISHLGQVNMLATHDCTSKSIHDPTVNTNQDVDEEENNETDSVNGEEFKKFGAADTFKFSDDNDFSRFS